MAKDPVCGVEVDELRARSVGIWGGRPYYFCSPDHKDTFARDPQGFLGFAPGPIAREPSRPERFVGQVVVGRAPRQGSDGPRVSSPTRAGAASRSQAVRADVDPTTPEAGRHDASSVAPGDHGDHGDDDSDEVTLGSGAASSRSAWIAGAALLVAIGVLWAVLSLARG